MMCVFRVASCPTGDCNLDYHDGRIADYETSRLSSPPESEKPGVVSPMVLCRLFRFPVVTLLGKCHRVCRYSRPVWVFTCDLHMFVF